MKRVEFFRIWFVIVFFCCGCMPLWAWVPPPLESVKEIVIQNKVLARVNDQSISVLDLVKQMDLILSRHYPEYLDSKTARYYYYSSHWRNTLQHLIDQELIMIDAETLKIKIGEGDVKEEIQRRFAPNVMQQLDVLGITYDEMKKVVHRELVIERMQWFRVTSRVLHRLTAEAIKKSYQAYLEKVSGQVRWKYQFLTIRFEDLEEGKRCSNQVLALKEESSRDLSVAAESIIKRLSSEFPNVKVSLSQELSIDDMELSESHREVLSQISQGDWSSPIIQVSRDGTTIIRLFHLKGQDREKIVPFEELAKHLKEELFTAYFNEENQSYLNKLRIRFGFDDNSCDIPSNFEPFSIL